MNQNKIVITGIGALAPNGNNVPEFWENLTKGVSGIAPITYFNTVKIAGELKNVSTDHIIDPKEIRKLDPFSIYAILATHEAIEMSGLNNQSFEFDRAGVVIGTGVGGIQTLEDQHSTIENRGARRVSPQFVPKMISNIAGGHLSLK